MHTRTRHFLSHVRKQTKTRVCAMCSVAHGGSVHFLSLSLLLVPAQLASDCVDCVCTRWLLIRIHYKDFYTAVVYDNFRSRLAIECNSVFRSFYSVSFFIFSQFIALGQFCAQPLRDICLWLTNDSGLWCCFSFFFFVALFGRAIRVCTFWRRLIDVKSISIMFLYLFDLVCWFYGLEIH